MPCASQSFLDLGQKSPARILLAEDHPYVREVLCEMLSGLGCILDTIDNGVEAIELGCNGAYDIIFLDMWMPGRSGTDVAREIRTAVPAAARPWLVGISASSRPEDREACLAAGMNDFLPKPVDQAALQAALRRAGWLTAPPDRIPSAENGSSVGIVSSRKWRSKFGANFEEEMRVLVEVIARGVEAGEWSLVHERTHYLENSALCVGRSDVAAACAKLVGAARARTSELSAAALASLRNAALHGRSGEVSS
jgi:CheY-like chemotaxis protein